MIRRKALVGIALGVLLALAGAGAAGAQEVGAQLAVYAAAPKLQPSPGVISSVVATKAPKVDAVIPVAVQAAKDVVWSTTKAKVDLVTVVVVFSGGEGEIQLKDYPLGDLKQVKATYAASLEIVPPVTNPDGTQVFNPALRIIVTYPDKTEPFLLSKDKSRALYLSKMGGTLPKEEGFFGKVISRPAAHQYEILVDGWPPGDPCLGGG